MVDLQSGVKKSEKWGLFGMFLLISNSSVNISSGEGMIFNLVPMVLIVVVVGVMIVVIASFGRDDVVIDDDDDDDEPVKRRYRRKDDPERVLKMRLANGEISAEEFSDRMSRL